MGYLFQIQTLLLVNLLDFIKELIEILLFISLFLARHWFPFGCQFYGCSKFYLRSKWLLYWELFLRNMLGQRIWNFRWLQLWCFWEPRHISHRIYQNSFWKRSKSRRRVFCTVDGVCFSVANYASFQMSIINCPFKKGKYLKFVLCQIFGIFGNTVSKELFYYFSFQKRESWSFFQRWHCSCW